MSQTTFEEFIASKRNAFEASGFEIDESELNPLLFDFQKFTVKRALESGRFAIWSDCGTGKTLMQLEWAYQVYQHTQEPVLILAPLAITAQTLQEADKFGYKGKVGYYGTDAPIQLTNYEQLDNINATQFAGVVLDESGILKNYTGAYRNKIIEAFQFTKFKTAFSATPSPNDELEIGNHAEFLNVMTSVDMRAMFFTTDKEIIKGNKYRLKKHAEKDFYKWISTWALMFSKPSDIGFSAKGYELPPLHFIERKLTTEVRETNQLFNSVTVSATNFNAELRLTKLERLEEAAQIVNNSKESFIVWVKHNEEEELLKSLIPDAVVVTGSDSVEAKRDNLLAFANGKHRVLITKTKIAAMGLNFQVCHNQVFASLDFSFESLYQAVRRSYRFGQKQAVNIYLITLDTMQNVIQAINEKQDKFINMQNQMKEAILSNTDLVTKETQGNRIYQTDTCKVMEGDCLELIKSVPENSIGYSFFSPPFGALYVFSNDPRDMSNVRNNDEFLQHFSYLVPELLRVLKPGRLLSIHIMQGTTLLGRDGFYSIVDFRGDIIRMFQKAGFYFHAEHMIRKDPKTAAIRTKNRQLMHGTTKKDAAIVRPGLADYILTFRKPGENQEPIRNDLPFDLWCKMAEPVWTEVLEGDTLEYRSAKANEDERHLTPTQLKPIEWCYQLWSNEGDTILCPFGGIGSEGYQAIKMNRKIISFELKASYFDVNVKNMQVAEAGKSQLALF